LRQTPGAAIYGLWLNQKGKVVADSVILRRAETDFLLVSVCSAATLIMQRLEQYIIADDVVLQNETERNFGLAIWGEGCGELLNRAFGTVPAAGRFLRKGDLLILPGHRTKEENYELVGPEMVLSAWLKEFIDQGGVEVNTDEAEFARIAAAIPSVPQDIGPTDLPNEAGLETTAISFTKGCFLGQEVMARLKNMGQVRRQLSRLRGTGPVPKGGTLLYQGVKQVGEIRSVASVGDGFIALAMLTRLGLDENVGFSFEPSEDPGLAKIIRWTN
jgi:folate-binding protein YgfZ